VVFDDVDGQTHTYETLVRKDPAKKPVVSLAAFTGMGVMGRTVYAGGPSPGPGEVVVGRWRPANVWMPFAQAVDAIQQQDVDILFFTGDQVYETKPSPKDFSWEPAEDYLYKWLLWHWSFRPLTRSRPAICQPDDHDVYHGNVWGWGGRLNLTGRNAAGGYLCSPYFVNLVERTQAGHNPDAFDPGPADTGIMHYYGSFNYGGIGFAVLEDRKFKTPGSVTDPGEQTLLGSRQLEFLRHWGRDWAGQAFKVAVSQTVYASMHVRADGHLARDVDSNGFPKVGRDRAIDVLRRCNALIVCGDQHLATVSRMGIENPSDAVYQFCVPALGNIFWRWFYPALPGTNRKTDAPPHLGEFQDPFGNYFRMVAVANPERAALLSGKLRQRHLIPEAEAATGLGDTVRTSQGDGYGIVRFDKPQQQLTIECWPHNTDPAAGTSQFPGWPVTLGQDELDGRKPVAWLPDLAIQGASNAVVQITDQNTGELVKITRARDGRYRPGVFVADHQYTLRVGDPESEQPCWEGRDLRPTKEPGQSMLQIELPR
jgi:alkaline phosphatase D